MINTINVIEIPSTFNMTGIFVNAFPDTPEGNRDAEKLFAAIVRENQGDVTDDDMTEYITDGYYEQDDYWVGLVHSTETKGEDDEKVTSDSHG